LWKQLSRIKFGNSVNSHLLGNCKIREGFWEVAKKVQIFSQKNLEKRKRSFTFALPN
jgi:hypothetical protein